MIFSPSLSPEWRHTAAIVGKNLCFLARTVCDVHFAVSLTTAVGQQQQPKRVHLHVRVCVGSRHRQWCTLLPPMISPRDGSLQTDARACQEGAGAPARVPPRTHPLPTNQGSIDRIL